MTSPTNVGSVEVSVLADAKALAKDMKTKVEKAFKDLDLAKSIQDATGRAPIKVKVDPLVDTKAIGRAKVPNMLVELEPVVAAFQQEVRRQTSALSRTVKVFVPTEPDTSGFSARLKAETAAAASRAKATVKVDVDTKRSGALSGIGSAFKNITGSLPSLNSLSSGVAELGSNLQRVAGSSAQLGGALSGAFLTATGPAGALAGAILLAAGQIAAIGTAAVLAVPAVSALAGAIAAIPGLLTGIGAGFGALSLGFKGIGDAFKTKAGGGGGGGGGGGEDPASRARRIAGAERGVEAARRGIAAATRGVQSAERNLSEAEERVVEAQRRAAQAQRAINRARIDAKENIEDLTRSLAGAKLSEEDAALGVSEALRELNAAKETGNLPDIQRADLAYRQAIQTLDEAKDTTEDLGIEQADAAKKGIEGSDLVQRALQDQAEALEAVEDAQAGVIDAQGALISANDGLTSSYDSLKSAQDSLAEAQKKTAAASGGGGGAIGDVVKLAPAAQRFVDAIKRLKPAFEDLRLGVQQRLFAGLDKSVTNLGQAWIPALKRVLGSYADTFNGFFKNLGKSLGKPQFIADIETGAEGARKGLEKIGKAISGPLVEAFGTLSAASAPFLEALGDEIGKVVTKFSEWVKAGNESGALQEFFKNATKSMRDIFDIGGSVASIIGSIISIIAGRGKIGGGKTPLEDFKEGLAKVAKYLDDPAVQEGIRQFFEDIGDGVVQVVKFAREVGKLVEKLKVLKSALSGDKTSGAVGGAAGGAAVALADAANKAGYNPGNGTTAGADVGRSTGQGFLGGFREALKGLFTAIPNLLWSGPDSLIGRIKSGLGIASPSRLTTTMGMELINGLIQGMGDKAEELKQRARELPEKIRDGIGNAAGFLVRKGEDFATGLRNGMSSARASVQAKAAELKTRVSNAFSNAGTLLTGRGQGIANSLMSGINQVARNVSITASNLKIRVQNAFSNAGTLLVGTGRNLVYGLWNGIASLGGYLRDRIVSWARANIPGPLHKFFGIASPSKLMKELGGHLATGLAIGIEDGARRVSKATTALEAAALPQLETVGADLFGPAADASIVKSLAVASAQQVLVGFDRTMTGDWLQDGLKRNIKFTHRGDVQAALGSS